MSTTIEPQLEFETISVDEGKRWLDREARSVCGISGDEFIRKYCNADIADLFDIDPSALSHLSMLLPFAGVAKDAWKKS